MAKYKVLSTKNLDPSLIEQAKQNDIEIIEQEFISIKPIWNQQTSDAILNLITEKKIGTIALTSANAVDVLNSVEEGDWLKKAFKCISSHSRTLMRNYTSIITK